MNILQKIALNFAAIIDKLSWKIKNNIVTKLGDKFDKEHGIKKVGPWNCDDKRYNRYEGTNPLAMESLLRLEDFSKNDHFVEIGCGHGRLLMFMAEHGFKNLVGIEYDHLLYSMCQENINTNRNSYPETNIKLINGRAEETKIENEWNVFYIFNCFRDKEVYINFLNRIKESVALFYRRITIIVLLPTESSLGAFCDDPWLKSRRKVYDQRQPCYRCAYFYIFSNE